jgi:hypothetical protein
VEIRRSAHSWRPLVRCQAEAFWKPSATVSEHVASLLRVCPRYVHLYGPFVTQPPWGPMDLRALEVHSILRAGLVQSQVDYYQAAMPTSAFSPITSLNCWLLRGRAIPGTIGRAARRSRCTVRSAGPMVGHPAVWLTQRRLLFGNPAGC